MVAKTGKDGKPVARPDWSCRICAFEFQDELVPPTVVTWKMLQSHRSRDMLCVYGRESTCKQGHEKKDNHLCRFGDLYGVLRQRQISGRRVPRDEPRPKRVAADNTAGISDKDRRIAELEKEAARKDRHIAKQRECIAEGKPWEEPDEEEEEPKIP